MVKVFIFSFIMLITPSCVFSEGVTELIVIVDKSQVEMGKYLSVRIISTGKGTPENSRLEKWYDDFFVEHRSIDAQKLSNNNIQTTEYLRLYPREIGDKVLHSIALGGAIAQPVKIQVKPSIRNGIDGTPHWQTLPKNIWQGETIKVSVLQNLLRPSNQVVVEEVFFPGFYVQKMTQEIFTENGLKKVRVNWFLTAQSHGLMQLDAPAIVQRGRGRWQFYLPRRAIKVKPMLSYVPPTVPVGNLSIKTGIEYKNNKPFWFVALKNKGALPEEIYGMRTQLSKLSGLSIELIEISNKQLIIENSAYFVQRYQLPVPDWTFGITPGPEIVVPYFNTLDGQLKSLSKKLPNIWFIPKVGIYTILGIAIVIGFLLLLNLFNGIKAVYRWQQFRSLVTQVNTSHELRQLLMAQGNFSTLDEWSTVQSYSNNKGFEKLHLAFPFFRRGIEGVVSLAFNLLIILKLLHPLNPSVLLIKRKGEVKKQRKSIFSSTPNSILKKKIARKLNTLCYANTLEISMNSINEIKNLILQLQTLRYWYDEIIKLGSVEGG